MLFYFINICAETLQHILAFVLSAMLWRNFVEFCCHKKHQQWYVQKLPWFDAKSVGITNRIGAFVNYVLLGWIFILSSNVIGSSFFRVMSDSTPCWAPTTAEIQTWEPRGGGRGFAPSGMGRGSAKWSLPGTRTSLGRSLDPELNSDLICWAVLWSRSILTQL